MKYKLIYKNYNYNNKKKKYKIINKKTNKYKQTQKLYNKKYKFLGKFSQIIMNLFYRCKINFKKKINNLSNFKLIYKIKKNYKLIKMKINQQKKI